MKDAPTGIFNPFEPPKKKKPSIRSLEERRTESGILVKPSVTLDGDSYILKFEGVNNVDQAVEVLTNLLYDVNKDHEALLDANGIGVFVGNGKQPELDEMMLVGPKYTIMIYVGEPPHEEVIAYRRIAYTLKKLPIGMILKRYKATLSERG